MAFAWYRTLPRPENLTNLRVQSLTVLFSGFGDYQTLWFISERMPGKHDCQFLLKQIKSFWHFSRLSLVSHQASLMILVGYLHLHTLLVKAVVYSHMIQTATIAETGASHACFCLQRSHHATSAIRNSPTPLHQ